MGAPQTKDVCVKNVFAIAMMFFTMGTCQSVIAQPSVEDCLRDLVHEAADQATVESLRDICAGKQKGASPEPIESDQGVVSERLSLEKEVEGRAYTISPHRANYILPVTYSTHPNNEPFAGVLTDGNGIDHTEAKFQISFKIPLAYDLAAKNSHLYFGFTSEAYWQLYNSAASAPFRETNYEPEIWWQVPVKWDILGFRGGVAAVGLVHQSNGRSELDQAPLSRSWNRVYVNLVLERGNLAIAIRPWWRLPEDDDDDNNPDIDKYYGYGDFRVGYRLNEHIFTGLLRNNLRSNENKGAIKLTWSHPITGVLRVYTEFFNGYGESLLDYNKNTTRYGIGVAISDVLQ